MFVRRAHTQQEQISNKLSFIADGTYKVTSLNSTTVTIKVGPNLERLFRDRITQSPITASSTSVILNDVSQAIANSNARTSHWENLPQPDTGNAISEYTIDRFIDYRIANDQSALYRVQWYGCGLENNTWKRIAHLPRSHIVRFHQLRSLLPAAALLSQSQLS